MIPKRNEKVKWTKSKEGNLTLIINRQSWIDRLFQKLFKTPKQTTLDLDKIGSFVWLQCDGKQNIRQIAKKLERKFPKEAAPIYERLITFIRLLKKNGLISIHTKTK